MSPQKPTHAVLLVNLGTPDQASRQAVRRYLRQFLMDPRVIDIPAILRWPLVKLAIAPFRSKTTTEAYQKILLPDKQLPLRVYSDQITKQLALTLGEGYQVELAMRYGNPSIVEALKRVQTCQQLTVIPLFPQYSSAATGSAIEAVMRQLSKQHNLPTVTFHHRFYHQPRFIKAYADHIARRLENAKIDKLLFSYHSLPDRHITQSGCRANCNRLSPCPAVNTTNAYCYRAQCYETSKQLATILKLPDDRYQTVFQSRLGRIPWVQPYLDQSLNTLIKQGIRRIAIASPSFVVDCLETLEEIAIRTTEQWYQLGGEQFITIPCLNQDPQWIQVLANMVKGESPV